jgi:glucose 1-dehydrogenase
VSISSTEENRCLSDRRVLVTGSAQGLGLGIARRLASRGARVALTDIDPVVTDRALEPVFSGRAITIVKDLADADSAEYLIHAARQEFNAINALVNCGAWSFHKSLPETTIAEFDRLIAINQRAPFFLSQEFAAQLTEADCDPCIVNISSVNALIGNPNLVAYAGTKGALAAMTRAMAIELAPRVRAVAISPGAVKTYVTEQLIQKGEIRPEELLRRTPIARFIAVEEVAELVAFLLGPAGGAVTGSNWVYDGGYTAQ